MSRSRILRVLPVLVALVATGAVAGPPAALALPAAGGTTAGAATAGAAPDSAAPDGAGLLRPAADDPALRGAMAPTGGVVPGLTGPQARAAAGSAADRFQQLTEQRTGSTGLAPAAQLHTDWGVNMPSSQVQGLHATQSVLTGTSPISGGDYVYAPTALPPGNACIEMTTAYTPSGPDLWAWDWCGGRDTVGKLTAMNTSFFNTYTTTVNGRTTYSLDEHRTSTTANTWTAYLYNYQTHAWDTYYTSSGTYDLPQFSFGWNMFEVYTTVNPATGAGYYCHDLAGRAFESSGVQVMSGSTWVPVTTSNSTAPSPAPGSRLDCPALTFTMVHPNDDWLGQISGGGGTTPPPTGTSYEAEATSNTRAGQAAVRSSSGASGGALVGYVGGGTANYLQFNNVNVGTAGSHTVTIYYTSGENRSTTVSVNGGAATTVNTPSSGGWDTVGSVSVTLNLNAGANTIRFGNPSGWAPDFDRIVVV
ncbi:carbohydrate-binding protein [Rugosimonospora africana]|uniref:CBM6 domain-containing protein n=1 Tax=Rugosimonospora africana TaxID=556532 RepID=A0A8J3VQQ5_9ACTN|nr:carbohydrate-binding protein [Rugosimonospora africana]GIH15385.1 hypothetical protein Raf01_35570 [Rugosimonospora africana]